MNKLLLEIKTLLENCKLLKNTELKGFSTIQIVIKKKSGNLVVDVKFVE